MVKIYFIRHGETDYNKLGISQGQKPNVDINQKGLLQSHKTGIYLNKFRKKDGNFDLIISSPLLRARNTAIEISRCINYNKDIIFDDNLMELDMGKYTGKSKKLKYKVLKEQKEKIENLVNNDPIEIEVNKKLIENFMFKKFNMETSKIAKIRAKKFINKIKNKYYKFKKIIIVSHGKIMENIFKCMFKIPKTCKDIMSENNDSNCFISYIIYKKNKNEFKMITMPSNLHLDLKY